MKLEDIKLVDTEINNTGIRLLYGIYTKQFALVNTDVQVVHGSLYLSTNEYLFPIMIHYRYGDNKSIALGYLVIEQWYRTERSNNIVVFSGKDFLLLDSFLPHLGKREVNKILKEKQIFLDHLNKHKRHNKFFYKGINSNGETVNGKV